VNAPFLPAPITVRKAELADPTALRRIDAWVSTRADAEPFHRPQWSVGVERGCRQRSHFLVAQDCAGAITGCLPLVEIRSFLFGNALVSTGFGTGGGILADDEATAEALAAEAWSIAGARGCGSVELRGGRLPQAWPIKSDVYAAFSCRAEGDERALLASIPRRQRAEIRKALALGLDVTAGNDRRHRDAFYRVYSESVRNLGTPIFSAALFDAMAEAFGDAADMLVVWAGGAPVSAFFNFYMGATAYAYWGGGTAEARRFKANDLVYFAFIRHAAARGCLVVDFGRSKLGTGACDRKRIWSFDERPLVYAVRTAEGVEPREINPLSPKYRLQVDLWRRLPLPVANRLGPLIARGLG
jgi:FemAB-related protein (PEP-CTERM system-associated)